MRRQGPALGDSTDNLSLRQANSMMKVNDATGAMNASPDELVGLHAKVSPAVGAR